MFFPYFSFQYRFYQLSQSFHCIWWSRTPKKKSLFFFCCFSLFFLLFFSCRLSVLFSLFFNRVYASPVLVVKRPSDRFRCFCLSGSLYLTDQRHRCIESDGCNAKRLPFNNSWKTGKARFVAFYSSCSMHQSAFFIWTFYSVLWLVFIKSIRVEFSPWRDNEP